MSFRDLAVKWILKVSVKIDAKNKRCSFMTKEKQKTSIVKEKLLIFFLCYSRVSIESKCARF